MMTAPRSFVTIGFSVKLPVRTIRTIVYSVLSLCVCSGCLWPHTRLVARVSACPYVRTGA